MGEVKGGVREMQGARNLFFVNDDDGPEAQGRPRGKGEEGGGDRREGVRGSWESEHSGDRATAGQGPPTPNCSAVDLGPRA
eukprot:scaffold22691_cov101-Isochrysis_galbana.AAC.5